MHSVNKLRVIGARRPNLWSTENHPRPALGVRIWTRLLAALHESRKQEAARRSVEFVMSSEGQTLLERYGYRKP